MAARTWQLFVYGTLDPAGGTRMGDWIAARLVRAEPACVPGRLFGLRSGDGWFPALAPARGPGRVRGVLCTLRLNRGELALLDRYEGAEYRRIAVRARTAAGWRCAQAYRWHAALPARAPAIPAGDFAAWLRRTRRKPFAAPGTCA